LRLGFLVFHPIVQAEEQKQRDDEQKNSTDNGGNDWVYGRPGFFGAEKHFKSKHYGSQWLPL
jgi:hypothetical protein